MAYPGEKENKDYMDYVVSQQEAGQPAKPKDQWRQDQRNQQMFDQAQKSDKQKQGDKEELDKYRRKNQSNKNSKQLYGNQ